MRAPGLATWLVRVAPAAARGSVAVAIVSDRRVRALNRAYRGVDRSTDVLSFPAAPAPAGGRARTQPEPAGSLDEPSIRPTRLRAGTSAPARSAPQLGDIVIARGTAARQARQAGHALGTELRVLALHGLLHLLGYDHDSAEDAGRMRRAEARLRRKGGLREGLIEREGRA